MKGYKRLIEKYEVTDDLIHNIFLSTDEERVFLNVVYDKRFQIEKMFKNNAFGLMELQKVRDCFDTEEKILEYFGIGDIDE